MSPSITAAVFGVGTGSGVVVVVVLLLVECGASTLETSALGKEGRGDEIAAARTVGAPLTLSDLVNVAFDQDMDGLLD